MLSPFTFGLAVFIFINLFIVFSNSTKLIWSTIRIDLGQIYLAIYPNCRPYQISWIETMNKSIQINNQE